MGLLLSLSTFYVPGFLRRPKLEMLLQATAAAFRTAAPSTEGTSFDDCLKLYARFTREQAENTIDHGRESETQSRLYETALRIGQQFRADFKVSNIEEVMRASRLIYRFLKIDFQGGPQGDILIRRCFFSTYYSSRVCRVISSLDEGLLVGLAGGGKLDFSRRMTDGEECCRARLQVERITL